MRKAIVCLLVVCGMAPSFVGLAMASEAESGWRLRSYAGIVTTGKAEPIKAPFGGTIGACDAAQGLLVQAGDPLFEMETTKVYAPCDGVACDLRGRPGDETAFLQDRYGAVMYLEPQSQLIVETTTKNAYNSLANKAIHIGETVYLTVSGGSSREGVGFVTAVNGSSYAVEVTQGDLVSGDDVSIFREAKHTSKSKIGSGTTKRNANIAIKAEGVLYRNHVEQGQAVRRGDLLFETVSGSAFYDQAPGALVTVKEDGIIASVELGAGDSAASGQTVVSLYKLQDLRIAVELSEADLVKVSVGDQVEIQWTGAAGQTPFTGTVESIAALNTGTENEPSYTTLISYQSSTLLLPGMNVTVAFLP